MTTQAVPQVQAAAVRPQTVRGRLPALAELFRVPGILRLSVSNGLVQGFGQRIQGVAVAWLVLDMTGSKFWLGLVNGLPVLSVVLFSLLGGVVADRYSARRAMLTTRSALAAIALSTAVLVYNNWIATGHLLIYVLLVVGIAAVDMPVARSFLYSVVGNSRLLAANAIQSVFMNAVNIVVPLSVGALIAFGGPGAAFLLLGAGYALSAVLIGSTARHEPAPPKASNPMSDVAAGLRYIRATPAIAALLGLAFLVPVAGIYFAMVPVFARDVLGVGAGGLGVLVAAFSCGGLAGSVYLSANGEVRQRGLKLSVIGMLFGLGMMAFALSQSFWLSCAISLWMGVLAALWQNMLGAMVQVAAAGEMRGRVTGVFTMGFQLVGLGWLAGGFLATVLGVEAAVLLGGIVFSGLSLSVFLVSPEMRSAD